MLSIETDPTSKKTTCETGHFAATPACGIGLGQLIGKIGRRT